MGTGGLAGNCDLAVVSGKTTVVLSTVVGHFKKRVKCTFPRSLVFQDSRQRKYNGILNIKASVPMC